MDGLPVGHMIGGYHRRDPEKRECSCCGEVFWGRTTGKYCVVCKANHIAGKKNEECHKHKKNI